MNLNRSYFKTNSSRILGYFLTAFAISSFSISATATTPKPVKPIYKGGLTKKDAAPKKTADVSGVPNATPKVEPKSRSGNPKSYVIKGKRYHVLSSAKGFDKVGKASWYGTRFHGKKTASGETYDLYAMTAASPNLPLPTYLKVTNLENNKTVIIKANDRGPFRDDRMLDLSYAAAIKLGFHKKGTAKVRAIAIDPVKWAQEQGRFAKTPKKVALLNKLPKATSKKTPTPKENLVQMKVGAFSSRNGAEQLKTRIAKLIKQPVEVSQDSEKSFPLYHVQITSTQKEHSRLQNLLRRHGLTLLTTVTG